jgi:hypothetical protein
MSQNINKDTRLTFCFSRWFYLRAILFSFVIILPRILLLLQGTGVSTAFFSDFDETLYLAYHIRIGAISWSNLIFELQSVTEGLSVLTPHVFVDIVFGKLHSIFNISIESIALYLDFVTVALTYPLFTRFFLFFCNSRLKAEVATIVVICFPFAFYFPGFFDISIPGVISSPFENWPSLPIHRAVYTQVSYPLFALSLLLTMEGVRNSKSVQSGIVAGLVTGFTLYFYLFAFLSVAAYLGLLIFLPLFVSGWSKFQEIKSFAISYILSLFAMVLGGVLIIIFCDSTSGFKLSNDLRFSLYLNPIALIEILVSGYFITRRSFTQSIHNLWEGIFICKLAILILVNLQSIVGLMITPYHFPVFFLIPLCSGFYFLLIVSLINKKQLIRVLLASTMAIAAYIQYSKAYSNSFAKFDIESTVSCLKQQSNGKNFWMIPFDTRKEEQQRFPLIWRIKPYAIAALSGLPNRELEMALSNELSFLKQESVYGWLINGKPSLIAECTDMPDYPTNLHTNFRSWQYYKRHQVCELASSVNLHSLFCDEISYLNTELVVWENVGNLQFSENIRPFLHRLENCLDKNIFEIHFPEVWREYCSNNPALK